MGYYLVAGVNMVVGILGPILAIILVQLWRLQKDISGFDGRLQMVEILLSQLILKFSRGEKGGEE